MTSRFCLTLALYVATVLLPVSGVAMSSEIGDPLRFLTVAPGIAYTTFRVHPRDAELFSGHAFKIDLDVAELHLVAAGGPSSRRTVDQIVAAYPAPAGVSRA